MIGLWWQERISPRARAVVLEIAAVGIPAVAALWALPAYPWSLAVALVSCALLPLRHVRPELGVVAVLPAVAGGLGWPAAVVALYALGRHARRPVQVWPWLLVVVIATVVPVQIHEELPWERLALTIAFSALYAGAPAVLAMLVSTRARLTASLRELQGARADAAAASDEAARAEERARIGREIHDAVGHHTTLIAVSAAALAASSADPATRESAEQIRLLAKRAIAEMRAALGLIDRSVTAPSADRFSRLEPLIAGARAAGVEVDVTHEGTRGEPAPGIARAVYRVVQESLTNAARHAPGQPVTIVLRWSDSTLSVDIRNPVTAVPPRLELAGDGGRGLAGLAERVVSVGGDLVVGPSETGSFTVTATFPLVAPAPTTTRRRPTLPALADATASGRRPA